MFLYYQERYIFIKPIVFFYYSMRNITCASTTKICALVISMCVVSIIIKHKISPTGIITHAILDNCSQGLFIVEDLEHALEVDGTDTSVVVKLLNGKILLKSKLVHKLFKTPLTRSFRSIFHFVIQERNYQLVQKNFQHLKDLEDGII